jgi:hypothetical protein
MSTNTAPAAAVAAPSCASCQFFLPATGEHAARGAGACRRYPRAEPAEATGWCGEHRPQGKAKR